MPITRGVAVLCVLLAALFPRGSASEANAETLTLTFAGDIMHHDTNAAMEDYDRLYDAVRPYLQSDTLSFANIEFPVDPGHEPRGYPLFNGTAEYVQAAIRGGFDVFALANNHTFDLGEAGVAGTAGQFSHIEAATGTYSNGLRSGPGAPITPTVIVRDGWSIAFVSVTSFSNEPGSSRVINLVDYSDEQVAGGFLELVSEWDKQYDVVVVSVHAGVEYTTVPDPGKVRFFRELVAHGADIVWGHHPHVLQRWEVVRSGPVNKLIIHSAGNFISAQRTYQQPFLPLGRWAPTGDAALFRVTIAAVGPTETDDRARATVAGVQTPMFTTHHDSEHGMILKSFSSVLTYPLPLAWRAFYATRYAATLSLLRTPLASLAIRPAAVPGL